VFLGILSDQFPRGDIYHPDFLLGRPAYFDLSFRSTTQSAVISSASSQAGVAAAGGEVTKDVNSYQNIVNENGGDFIPLVCVSHLVFGLLLPCQFYGQSRTGQLLKMVCLAS